MVQITITVRYFASLRERMGRSEEQLTLTSDATVGSVWRQVAPADYRVAVLAAINQEYAAFEQGLSGGDELAFFPPVTGG